MKALEILTDELRKEENILQLILNFKVSGGFIGAIPDWKKALTSFKTTFECEMEMKNDAIRPLNSLIADYPEMGKKAKKGLKANLELYKKERKLALEEFNKTLMRYRYSSELVEVTKERDKLKNELAKELFDRFKSYIGHQYGENDNISIQTGENDETVNTVAQDKVVMYKVENTDKISKAIANLIYTSKKYAYAKQHYKECKTLLNPDEKRYKGTIIEAMNESAHFLNFPIAREKHIDFIRSNYIFPEHVMKYFDTMYRTARQTFNDTSKRKDPNRIIERSRKKSL